MLLECGLTCFFPLTEYPGQENSAIQFLRKAASVSLRSSNLLALVIIAVFPAPVRGGGFAVARYGGEHGNPATEHPTAIYFNPAGLALGTGWRIYAEGIATGDATFETEPPTWEEFDAGRLPEHRLVAEEAGEVVGWAAVSPTSQRECYAGVVEHSVYVAESARGRGIGARLMAALVASTDAAGIWTIQTSIFPENAASLALHERVGFRVVGRRERIARLDGVWRDTLLLERRARSL